jgi:hypothetical protein
MQQAREELENTGSTGHPSRSFGAGDASEDREEQQHSTRVLASHKAALKVHPHIEYSIPLVLIFVLSESQHQQ